MELYHGSRSLFDIPNITKAKMWRDFGAGFYCAENINDALSISVKHGSDGWLYTYEIDVDFAFDNFNVLEFDGFDLAWAEFIYHNRIIGTAHGYDIVIGPTAGGHINDLFDYYRLNHIEYSYKIGQDIVAEASNTSFGVQWCFMTQEAVEACLKLATKEYIERG